MQLAGQPLAVRAGLAVAVAAALASGTGCSASQHAGTAPTGAGTTSAGGAATTLTTRTATTPPTSPVTSAGSPATEVVTTAATDVGPVLTRLSQAAAGRSYSARYRLTTTGQPTATIDVASTPAAYSLTLTAAGSTSLFLVDAKGSYSCELGTSPRCFLAAAPGQQVPAALDPMLEQVFRRALPTLAAHLGDYAVTRSKDCFEVRDKASATTSAVSAGTYCWSADGMVTRYVSATGVLALLATGPAPTVASIVPPVR